MFTSLRSRGSIGKLTARHITVMAVLFAFRFALGLIPAFNVGNMVKMGFGFIGTAFFGAILGPWYGALAAFLQSVLNAVITGQQFFIGFDLASGLAGFIYGYFFWRRPINWKSILVAVTLVTLIVNLGLNSLWIRILQDKAWVVFMPMRILKNAISLPLNTLILSFIFRFPQIKQVISRIQF
ncbi:folate family ECF transporter S component [Hutsoniella sourekii]|uniref:folate family ECF transporter S component n=1 Tax=Hutsoniella sourekii TaxID=87650 RepID=UPI0004B17E6E|nr:folate family ECF transporter S component [Hutsoniella sourekii]